MLMADIILDNSDFSDCFGNRLPYFYCRFPVFAYYLKGILTVMYKIVRKEVLNPTITLLEVEAPFVAKKAKPGQFIILRIDEKGERLPLTIGGFDREKGTVTIIFQLGCLTTKALARLNPGDYLLVS